MWPETFYGLRPRSIVSISGSCPLHATRPCGGQKNAARPCEWEISAARALRALEAHRLTARWAARSRASA